jgi:hypothetical protein
MKFKTKYKTRAIRIKEQRKLRHEARILSWKKRHAEEVARTKTAITGIFPADRGMKNGYIEKSI